MKNKEVLYCPCQATYFVLHQIPQALWETSITKIQIPLKSLKTVKIKFNQILLSIVFTTEHQSYYAPGIFCGVSCSVCVL